MSNNNQNGFWDDEDSVPEEAASANFWEEDSVPLKSEKESFVRGAAQGASFGFADEITGGIEALKDIAMTDKELDDFVSQYKQRRDESRKEYDQAAADNPWSYGTGAVAGGVASSFVPGAAALNVGKGASFATHVGKGALAGGIAGVGASKADITRGEVGQFAKDAVTDAALGGVMGGALYGVGKALNKAPSVLGKGAKAALDLDDEAINAVRSNKGLYQGAKNAPSLHELGDMLEEGSKNAFNTQKEWSNAAWDAIQSQAGLVPPGQIEDAAKELSSWGEKLIRHKGIEQSQQGAQMAAKSAIRKVAEDASKIKSLGDIKKLIQNIDDNINWDNPNNNLKNELLTSYRTYLDDIFKTGIPDYREAMVPLAQTTDDLSKLTSRLGMQKRNVEGVPRLVPTDRTTASLDTLVNQALSPKGKGDQLRAATGRVSEDFDRGVREAALKRYLEKDTARGSRSAVAGGFGGAALSTAMSGLDFATGGTGAAIGAGVGWARDKFGRQLGLWAIDKATHGNLPTAVSNWASRTGIPSKFASILADAAKRGERSLIIAHTLLKEREPEYKALMEEAP